MNWQPGTSRYYEQADSYRVSAARIGRRWRFSAWRLDGERWQLIGVYDTAAEARSVCERHKSERAAA